ncbi:MAG: DMT family transporter [Methanocella sp.]
MSGEKPRNDLPLIIGLFAINMFWGASFIANDIALRSILPIEIASLRFFIAAPLLAALALLWKGPGIFRMEKNDLPAIIVMAVTGVTLQYILQVTAQSYTTAINLSLILNLSTFFILFLGALFLGERLTASRVIGAFVGFGGVALLVSGGTLAFSLGQVGDAVAVFCALLWAVYSIVGKKIAGKYHPLAILVWVFAIGAVCMMPFYVLTPHGGLSIIPVSAWGAILFLAVFCSIIAYLVYNLALETMDASQVALFIYLIPLATIILSWVILGKGLTLASGFGGLLVLAGMWIAERNTRK